MAEFRREYGEFSYLRRRARAHFLSSTINLALVLLVLGIFATISVFFTNFSKTTKESMPMKVMLIDGADSAQVSRLSAELDGHAAVRSFQFISKDQAANRYLENVGEDVRQILEGINPLLPSIDVYLRADYIQSDSLQTLIREIEDLPFVTEAYYPQEQLLGVSENTYVLSILSVLVGMVVIIVALYLVFGNIRLRLYAQRLTIRSMQLIGATDSFIRRPYMWAGFAQGVLAGLVSTALLSAMLMIITFSIPSVQLFDSEHFLRGYLAILGGVVLFGALLGLLGSYMAVNRYLGRNLDELMS